MLADFDLFKDYGVFSEREDALPRRASRTWPGAFYRIDFPEAIYDAGLRTTASSTGQSSARLRVLHDAAVGLRLRHGDERASS